MNQIQNTNNFNKITQDINIFKGSFPKTGKIIGIDLGKKTLGIAISDNYRKIALTHKTIFRKKLNSDLLDLNNIIEKNDITSLVLGLPLNKDGTKGPSAQSAITFASILHKNFNLPTLLWDERFATIVPKAIPKLPIYAEIDPPPGAGDSEAVSSQTPYKLIFINGLDELELILYSMIFSSGLKGATSFNPRD